MWQRKKTPVAGSDGLPKGAEYRSRVRAGRKAMAHQAAGKSLANARGRKTQPPPMLEMRDTVRVNNNKGTGSGSQTISLDYGGSAEVYAQVKASSSATAWSTVGTVTVNAPAAVPLTTGTFTTNGTKTPGSGYSGFSSVTINVPTGYTGLTVDTTNKRVTVSTSTTTTYATISAGTITAQETTTAGQNVLSVPI